MTVTASKLRFVEDNLAPLVVVAAVVGLLGRLVFGTGPFGVGFALVGALPRSPLRQAVTDERLPRR